MGRALELGVAGHRPPRGSAGPGLLASTTSPRSRARDGQRASCVRTSSTGSSGSRSCTSTGSAACSPTTWVSARRCRRWRCSCHAKDTWRTGRRARSSWSRRRACVANWAAEARRFAPGLRRARRSATRGPARRRARRRCAGADVVVTSYALFRLEYDDYARRELGRADARRGAVRQEPPVARPTSAPAELPRAVQARDHRHADGEQPDGAVVAALDRRPRAVPEPERFTELLPRPIERGRGRRACSPSCAGGSAR